jgi:GNAT superfamily N-acetyltransferase
MLEAIADDDVPGIVSLMNRAYRGAGASAGWNSEAAYIAGDRTTESLLRADLRAKPDARFLKWTDPPGGGLLGCVWLERFDGSTWYLGSLATDPDRQNSGAGKTLLAAAEQWIRSQGGNRVRMTVVNVRDTLIAWYVRRGYHLTGETEPFPYGDDRFGTPLRDDLAFVVLEKALD